MFEDGHIFQKNNVIPNMVFVLLEGVRKNLVCLYPGEEGAISRLLTIRGDKLALIIWTGDQLARFSSKVRN